MLVNWERARSIFKHPAPPKTVWQRQFDGYDDMLRQLARTPYENIDFSDLFCYYNDLAYVELQPDLFAYLFPVCLMAWHETLMTNNASSHCETFHYGLLQGNVIEKMLTPYQQNEVFKFFRDSFLERLDSERGTDCRGGDAAAHSWYYRFNSVGIIMPHIELLWSPWWMLETPGRAVAALEYCSGLMYLDGNNPLFGVYTPDGGGGGPYLWSNDCQADTGWMPQNIEFMRSTLTVEFVNAMVEQAVERLRGEPEWETARQIETDLSTNQEWISTQDIIESRVCNLPHILSERPQKVHNWPL